MNSRVLVTGGAGYLGSSCGEIEARRNGSSALSTWPDGATEEAEGCWNQYMSLFSSKKQGTGFWN